MRPLPALTPSAVNSMLHELRNRGFACVSLQQPNTKLPRSSSPSPPQHQPWIQNVLISVTSHDASTMEGFRFPNPMEDSRPIVYTESKRLAFRALYEVATTCLSGLLLYSSLSKNIRDGGGSSSSGLEKRGREEENELSTCDTRSLHDALLRTNCGNDNDNNGGNEEGDDDGSSCCRHGLFHHDVNEPFGRNGMPFSQSFFNLFNYDHGSLNGHVDRSLLTVIYSNTVQDTRSSSSSLPSSSSNNDNNNNNNNNNAHSRRRSALWVKDHLGTWRNADQIVQPNQAIVMVGEDLERVDDGALVKSMGLYAAEHAVRVDPRGERIERSHFRRDPSCDDCEGVGNRASAALILRHELECTR